MAETGIPSNKWRPKKKGLSQQLPEDYKPGPNPRHHGKRRVGSVDNKPMATVIPNPSLIAKKAAKILVTSKLDEDVSAESTPDTKKLGGNKKSKSKKDSTTTSKKEGK